jgi:hypothetical protein
MAWLCLDKRSVAKVEGPWILESGRAGPGVGVGVGAGASAGISSHLHLSQTHRLLTRTVNGSPT